MGLIRKQKTEPFLDTPHFTVMFPNPGIPGSREESETRVNTVFAWTREVLTGPGRCWLLSASEQGEAFMKHRQVQQAPCSAQETSSDVGESPQKEGCRVCVSAY